MRPPEFTGGNSPRRRKLAARLQRFNEAAGIHRRKLLSPVSAVMRSIMEVASMRPPEFTGGNTGVPNVSSGGTGLQ